MKLKFTGAIGEVTGSMTLLTLEDNTKLLIDCGMVQGKEHGNFEEIHKINTRDFEFNPSEIDYVILTHCHADHICRLPLLVKKGFKGKIIATQPTSEFANLSLPDCSYINEQDVKIYNLHRGKKPKLYPMYSSQDAYETVSMIQGYSYNTEIVLKENLEEGKRITIELKSAGHILGACMVLIKYQDIKKKESILFTGDTSGKKSRPIVKVADDIGKVDYIVCESTYGNRVHKKIDRLEILSKSIQETCMDRKKTLLIPVFSLGRSTDIIWLLREVYLKEQGKFDDIPIYLDTPMGIKAQKIVDKYRNYWGEKWLKRDEELGNLFNWNKVTYTYDPKASKLLANGEPKIILSSSGMLDAGRINFHLNSFLPSKGCKILLTGYQAEGTLGRQILDKKNTTVNVMGKPLTIRANIEQMPFSGHADKIQLINLLKTSKNVKKIILNHGDNEARKELSNEIQRQLNIDTILPKKNKTIKL